MKSAWVFLLAMFWAAAGWSAEPYGYPFEDPFVATVVGTPQKFQAELPEQVPIKQGELRIFPDRVIPEVFWHQDTFRFSYAAQKNPAPLIFLIAGTGGAHNGVSVITLARAFFQAGFHVVTLSSPTHFNFIVSASRTSVPGDAVEDAEDLYRAMELIWNKLRGRLEATEFFLAGYSLGGFNAGFLARLDEQRRLFDFSKVLLINPPLSLYSSISLLDRMIENIPGGVDNFNRFFNQLVKGLTEVLKRSEGVNLGEDTLYKAYQALQLKDEELAALIGVSFRISSSNMIFASDVMTDFGFIKPQNVSFTHNSSLVNYGEAGVRLGFTDYFHEYFYPYKKRLDPGVGRQGLVAEMSLAAIEDYLAASDKVFVMHNQNDLILESGEIDFFRRVFGERAKIYPRGGHLGNMFYRDNIVHMVDVLQR